METSTEQEPAGIPAGAASALGPDLVVDVQPAVAADVFGTMPAAAAAS